MNVKLMPLALLAAFAAAPLQAGPLEDRVDALSSQVLELQGQVAQLRSMLNRDAAGTVLVTSNGSRKDAVGVDFQTSVGGNASSSFGRALTLAVAQSRTTQIGAGDALTVTGSSTSNVGGNWKLSVSGTVLQQASGNMSFAGAREILIQAGDQITLKTGDSTLVMKKDGSIAISGRTISVTGSGDVVIKGAKILQN